MPTGVDRNAITDYPAADRPTTSDLLGFREFVEALVGRIANAAPETTPFTIGVHGRWGTGKTSFLMMLDAALKTRGIRPVWFNAWKYDREDNLWAALIQTILNQAPVYGPWHRRLWIKLRIWLESLTFRAGTRILATSLLVLFLRASIVVAAISLVLGWPAAEIRVAMAGFLQRHFDPHSWLLVIAMNMHLPEALGIFLAAIATKPEALIKLFQIRLNLDYSHFRKSPSYKNHIAVLDDFNSQFENLVRLTGNGRPLVVIVDDLDRCLPEKAIQVLEAIKLFLDVRNCIFVLGVDRELIERAIVAKYRDLIGIRDVEGSSRQPMGLIGEDYFDKLIQIPFVLPAVSEDHFRRFLTEIAQTQDVSECLDILVTGLPRNPRKAKRLLQALLFTEELARLRAGPMSSALIAKMVIIQSQFRAIYDEITEEPELLVELERVCRGWDDGSDDGAGCGDPRRSSIRQKAKKHARENEVLRRILALGSREGPWFDDSDVAKYVFLTRSIGGPAEPGDAKDSSTPKPC
jgi:hypothetical protein